MELIAAVLLGLLASSLKKLIKSVAYRNTVRGKAELIQAKGRARKAEATGKAEIMRARAEATINGAKRGRERGKKSG
ncbi:hypothetical protein [Streptomyces xantholiticus]|uniref:hypothetical protein n=1 Tax=Streptomyces xantholiticus TaxID=68285 RepID=UPI00167918D5|nr:hypothetical protein [Streptomyces xantholiticus]GGW62812.1 hypothetical protein GCM10010381_54970 [Streptomyces xantholiticus]